MIALDDAIRAAQEWQADRTAADEDDFFSARPELAHIEQFARARMVGPWAMLGAVLSHVVAQIPYSVVLPPIVGGHASLNLAIGLVGGSGAGKGAVDAAACDAVDVGEPRFASHKLGSGQGIAHGYVQRGKEGLERVSDSCLFVMHEVDHMVGLSGQRGSTLMPELRSALMGEALGHLYVDASKRVPVEPHSYRFVLTVGIQPRRAGVLLDDADGGTPQRLVWLPATDPFAPDDLPDQPYRIYWDEPDWPAGPLEVCETAREAIVEARRAALKGHGDTLDGHRLLLREKIAAALDALSGHAGVSEEGWHLAGVVMEVSDRTRGQCLAELRAAAGEANTKRAEAEAERAIIVDETVEEEAIKRVSRRLLARLKDAPGREMGRGELRRGVTSRDRGYFDEAIRTLEKAGQVTTTGFNDATRYRLS